MPANIELEMLLGRNRAAARARPDGDTPLRILVLGALGGRAAPRSIAGVQPQRVDLDRFDAVLARLAGQVQLELAPGSMVSLAPASLEDLEPDALYAHLPVFKQLRELRGRLANPATFEQAAAELRALEGAGAAATTAPEDDRATLERLLGAAPAAASAAPAAAGDVQQRLQALLRDVVAPHVVPATAHLQQPLLASVDQAASHTLRGLLRHPQWREFEGNWRAVDHLLRNAQGDNLVVELLDVRADELLLDLAQAGGEVGRCSLAAMLEARAQRDGAESRPALWVALYDFGGSAPELALLAGLGALAAQCGGAVLAGAAPSLLGVADSAAPGDPSAWHSAGAGWQSLRASWVARHIGLVYPRLLSRLPYGPRHQPVAALAFDELADGVAHERLAWRASALDAAGLVAQAHAEDGWQLDLAEHLEIEDLPAFVDRSGAEPRLQAAAEAYVSDRQQQALHAAGVMPLVSDRQAPRVRLAGWHSVAVDGAPLAGPWAGR